MESKTFEQAQKFYTDKKETLLNILHTEFKADVDYQADYDQVAVWFDGFSICYQNSDMNGSGKGEPHWNNDGANSGIDELREILKKDERFNPLVALDEYWSNEYLNVFIDDFCADFAEKHGITDLFECNED
jgi:hypothetical protein